MKRPADPLRDILIEDYAQKLSGMKEGFATAQPWFRGHYRAVARRKVDAMANYHGIPLGSTNAVEEMLIRTSLP